MSKREIEFLDAVDKIKNKSLKMQIYTLLSRLKKDEVKIILDILTTIHTNEKLLGKARA